MTRRLIGSGYSSHPKVSCVYPIGHLSNKSSVYSPISMSHMSQDLVHNHMKSHYQRIASAKACVDTSAPKSLQLTIKGKDRKRRESLQKSSQSRPVTPSSSRKRQMLKVSQDLERDADFSEEESAVTDAARNIGHGKQRTASRPRVQAKTTTITEQPYGSDDLDRTSSRTYRPINTKESLQINMQSNRNNMLHEDYLKISRGYNNCSDVYNNFPRTDRVSHYDGQLNNDLDLQDSNHFKQINNSVSGQFDRIYTSTPRFERDHDVLSKSSTLGMSNISFSYKAPPSPRRRHKKSSQEIVWTEEQKYLHFISEVTSDVLARGIFSNRVLNRVFESYIEKRKGDLDEERMREMIKELKQDLGVTDD